MSPRTRHSLMVAAAVVGIAAIGGIAAIQGWIPDWFSGDTPASLATPGLRIAGTAPPDSLSPGETIVTGVEKAPVPSADEKPPVAAPTHPPPPEKKRCPNCGTVASLIYQPRDPHGLSWEVRVTFDDGTHRTLRFPTNPGFRVGERVVFANGRLQRS